MIPTTNAWHPVGTHSYHLLNKEWEEEQDTKLGMLTQKWAKIKSDVIPVLFQFGLHFYPYGKAHMWDLDKLKRQNCFFMVQKSFERPKRSLDQSPFPKKYGDRNQIYKSK